MSDFLPSIAAMGVGILIGLTGIGGGALMTPILVLLFGVSPRTAVGTDLLVAAITKAFGAAVHGTRGSIDWQIFRRLSAGSLPAAALTSLALLHWGMDAERVNGLISGALGGMLLLTAGGMLLRNRLLAVGRCQCFSDAVRFRHCQRPATVLAGAILGIVVTLTSVGAGAFGALLLLYLYPLRLTPAKLVGTDISHAVPLALVASMGHWMMDSVDWDLLASLLAGSIPGVLLGSWWSSKLPGHWLRTGIALMLGLSGIKILYS